MSDFQASKSLVLDLYRALDPAPAAATAEVFARFVTEDWLWRGMHPFNEKTGPEAVARAFWEPCKRAFMPLQRRQNIFFAGRNFMDGYRTEWVCSMGHLLGLFDAPWLGIRPTRKMSFLRYAEFHRIEGGRIAETALFVDIMGVMHQAGLRVFPESTGATVVTPGPQTQDGLLFDAHPEAEGRTTMALIQRMIDRLLATGVRTLKEDLELDWHEDMLWWGPAGIGAAYTHGRYIEQHCRPFEDGLEFLTHHGHVLEFAEGRLRWILRLPHHADEVDGRVHGPHLGRRSRSRDADRRPLPPRRRQARRELDLHRQPALPRPARSRSSGSQ